ncbi:MAG: Tn3 family transposase [Acidimicrobiales bacterium]
MLEVMAWEPGFIEAFTGSSGGTARMGDLDVNIAACLSAQAMNVGYQPIARTGVPALAPAGVCPLWHAKGCRMAPRATSVPRTWRLPTPPLSPARRGTPFAQVLGSGLVAVVDVVRFVAPVPSVCARPGRKYFGMKKEASWLNILNDQAAGLAAKVVSVPAPAGAR